MERKKSSIHVIVPCLNEEARIQRLIDQLKDFDLVTIVDGGSTDNTHLILESNKVRSVLSNDQGRAVQMNKGVLETSADYLLFLHADVSLPENFKIQLVHFINSNKPTAGNFPIKFDSNNWFLKFNALFSYLNYLPFQFGDQGLLIKRSVFNQLGGFDESLLFMEGNDLIKKIKRAHSFLKIPIRIKVSARKYNAKGTYRLQLSYYLIYLLTRVGISQKVIKAWFKNSL